MKKYLEKRSYEELKKEKKNKGKSNLLELKDDERLEIVYLLRERKGYHTVKKEWSRNKTALSASIGQIKQIEKEWKEALKEKKPKRKPTKK